MTQPAANQGNAAPRVDLSACDQEPIHIPGAIQPHGALLVARLDDWVVTHASANLVDWLGMPASTALGRHLAHVLDDEACRHIQVQPPAALTHQGAGLMLDMPVTPVPLQLTFHFTPDAVCVEFEAAPQGTEQLLPLPNFQAIVRALHAAGTQDELCKIVVAHVRELTGYDRVMVYRFDRDGSGQIIAENRAPDIEPYLGLRFPASDIPAQARRMYLQQRIRVIADAAYRPVPVLTDPVLGTAAPLDMTRCSLRSISPVHLEYLANMGVGASLCVSLVTEDSPNGFLWGQLVCHHRSPRIITADMRGQCELIGQMTALLLQTLGGKEVLSEQLDRQRMLHEIAVQIAETGQTTDALLARGDSLLGLLGATGAFVQIGQRGVTLGRTPATEATRQVMAALRATSGEDLAETEELGALLPTPSEDCCGALFLPLPSSPNDAIIWFRPEVERVLLWAGEPEKEVDETTGRLSPRRSFEAWSQNVSGHSAPWRQADKEAARDLRQVILTGIARQAEADLARLRSDVTTAIEREAVLKAMLHRTEEAEHEAQTMRSRLIDAIEAIPESFVLHDAEDRLVLCNSRYADLYQLGPESTAPGALFEDALRRSALRADPPIAPDEIEKMVAERLARHRAADGNREEQRLPNGRWLQVLERRTSDGGTVGIRIDVTEERQRAAAERDREKLAALGQLAGGVAHEINNLLQPALGVADLVRDSVPADDADAHEALEHVRDSARKMREIVRNILLFARKEDPPRPTSINLITELREAISFVGNLVPPSITVREQGLDVHRGAMVAVSKTQLTQVVTNLLVNAAQATTGIGTVTVSVTRVCLEPKKAADLEIEPGRTYLAVSVADTGSGMDSATCARIFEPFFTTKPVGQGTGLGLSVAYGILRSWGGAITVRSELGFGTTFVLYVPVIEERPGL
jgi:light-regulated signal transduction histidine kinase (bacteriophytochrome)